MNRAWGRSYLDGAFDTDGLAEGIDQDAIADGSLDGPDSYYYRGHHSDSSPMSRQERKHQSNRSTNAICKFCGDAEVKWELRGRKWRLVNKDGSLHRCLKYQKGKKVESKTGSAREILVQSLLIRLDQLSREVESIKSSLSDLI